VNVLSAFAVSIEPYSSECLARSLSASCRVPGLTGRLDGPYARSAHSTLDIRDLSRTAIVPLRSCALTRTHRPERLFRFLLTACALPDDCPRGDLTRLALAIP